MKKNGGFSLIEVLVVLGIIGILSSFITPKVIDYTAKAKEVKVKSVLESLRTASEMYYLEEGKSFMSEQKNITGEDLKVLEKYLSNNVKTLSDEKDSKVAVTIKLGGSRTEAAGEITRGGEVLFTTKDPDTENSKSDGIRIWVVPKNTETVKTGNYTLEGEKWIDL